MSALVKKFKELDPEGFNFDVYRQIKPLMLLSYLSASKAFSKKEMPTMLPRYMTAGMGGLTVKFKPYFLRFVQEEIYKEQKNERQANRNDSQATLDGNRAGVHGGSDPGSESGFGQGSRGPGQNDAPRNGRLHTIGRDRIRGVASQPGSGTPKSEESIRSGLTPEPAPAPPIEDVAHGNFRISGNQDYGTRGVRITRNIEAVRLLKSLQASGRKFATKEEQEVLSKFIGWGGLKSVFDPRSPRKQDQVAREELEQLLSSSEYFEARQSVLNAHYTRIEVVSFMYEALQYFGFEGGNVLEPTFGTGNFIGGIPENLQNKIKIHGSELDPVSAGIGQYLYPDANLYQGGFQNTEFPLGKFDVMIGNPPFGDETIIDRNPARKDISGMKIHNYVLAKAGKHLRPGGIISTVVTHRFLDTQNPEAREHLAQNFKFMGAVRLPNTAFKDSAGTEVVTDIIFLQKLMSNEKPDLNALWLNTDGVIFNKNDEPVRLNAYFAANPQLMLGEPSMKGTMYGDVEEFTLNPRPEQNLWEELKNVINEWPHLKNSFDPQDEVENLFLNLSKISIGGYALDENEQDVFMRMDDDENGNPVIEKLTPETQWTEKNVLGKGRLDRIREMLILRKIAYKLVDAERYDKPDIEEIRALLNQKYDQFVEKYGYINDNANASLMSDDVKIESGLEIKYKKAITPARAKILKVDPRPSSAEKSTILKERVFYPEQIIDKADSFKDAYNISLSEFGRIELSYIARLMNATQEETIEALSKEKLIYQDPETKEWIQEDLYLSGNVKKKYQIAMEHPGYQENMDALKNVFPPDLSADQIYADMGQVWIPEDVYKDFLEFMGVLNAQVSITVNMGQINIVNRPQEISNENNFELSNPDYSISQLFNLIANKKPVVAYDKGDNDKRVVNKERTKALAPIAKKFNASFRSWIFADPERTSRLEKLYNNTQNTHTERKFNGSLLKMVGNSPAIEHRDHQKSAAWRIIQSQATLLDHIVGAGKTFAAITGVMERKRLGLSRKQMIVVPNHLVGQWAKDFQTLYPGSNVLAATQKSFEKKNRKRLFAQIATGSFDAIICAHTSLGFIPIEPETEARILQQEVVDLETALDLAKETSNKQSIRTLSNRIAKKKSKIEDLWNKAKDDVATFEEMGIDHLVIDESHEFKNLEYATAMRNVVGMGTPKGSKRAFDLYSKIQVINEKNGAVTFATGTPISNSLVEMYSILKYLNRKGLEDRNLTAFDAWAKHFASVDSVIEYTASGRLKERQIMGSFNNLDELLQLYKGFADIVQKPDLLRIYAEQIKRRNELTGENEREEFPVPKIEENGRVLDIAPANDQQSEFMEYLVARSENLESNPPDPTIDNALWVMSDARKMALDIRLVDPTANAHPENKINRVANDILKNYQKWNHEKGTQLVFCDLSTPLKNSKIAAEKFISDVLKYCGYNKDEVVLNTLQELSWQDKWIYIQGKIGREIVELEEDDSTSGIARHQKLTLFLSQISAEDIGALITADTGFSVYDDLKAQLIELGIPEQEIRFIHEAKTSTQKDELFDQVNGGDVRVLIGSTKKMGAGMNVQSRLVALHHMDAPWRPSDVEQREGRIIRQGNLLYEKDPDNFRVAIKAYSTSNTFDAVMWQILSRKATMLEQFRIGSRSVMNIEGDSASYAEFMAESTGNPIFREKFHLENEVEELESMKRNIRTQRSAADRILKSAQKTMKYMVSSVRELKNFIFDMQNANTLIYDGQEIPLDHEKGVEIASQKYEKEVVEWEEKCLQYTIDIEQWAKNVESGFYASKTEANENKPKKPVGSPVKPTLSNVAQFSKFAAMMLDISFKFKSQGSGRIASVSIGGHELEFNKEFFQTATGSKAFLTVSMDGQDLYEKGARPEEVVFRYANPQTLLFRAEKALSWTEKELKTKSHIIRNAKFTASRMQFTKEDELIEKRDRLEIITEQINSIEDELSATRNAKNNKYIREDITRFGEPDTEGLFVMESAKMCMG